MVRVKTFTEWYKKQCSEKNVEQTGSSNIGVVTSYQDIIKEFVTWLQETDGGKQFVEKLQEYHTIKNELENVKRREIKL